MQTSCVHSLYCEETSETKENGHRGCTGKCDNKGSGHRGSTPVHIIFTIFIALKRSHAEVLRPLPIIGSDPISKYEQQLTPLAFVNEIL